MNNRGSIGAIALCLAGWVFAGTAAPAGGAHKPVSIAGDWKGTLNTGGASLRLVLHFVKTPGGSLRGSIDSLDQNAHGIPFSIVRQTGTKVHAESAAIHAKFDGTLTASGKSIAGTWVQTIPLPLTLTRMTAAEAAKTAMKPNRPQEPKPPFPYTAQDVTFPGGAAGVTLAGTLTLPLGQGPFPAAVLICGSGPNDRDEEIFGHKPFWVLADSLTRRGIAVLRYDKRGVGRSKGDYGQAATPDFADDAQAAAAWLRSQAPIRSKQVGLIGHSEGGLIAPMVAAKTPDTAFIVLLAGTGVPGERILIEQGALMGKAMGFSEADIAKNQAVQRAMFAIVQREPDPAAARAQVTALLHEMLASMPPALKQQIGPPEAFIQAQRDAVASPWMRFFLSYDPAPVLKQVRCPVLALDGSLDLQVPAAENLAAISAALTAGGNRDVTAKEFPRLNHLFQTAQTGSLAEYGEIEETLAPIVLTTVGDWVLTHTTAK